MTLLAGVLRAICPGEEAGAGLASGRASELVWLLESMPAGEADARVPGRSREQRLRALQRANEIRSARAKLKQDLASGKLDLAGIVADPPEWVMSARVRDLWLALPRIGPVKAGRILAQCGIAHSKTLGGLTDRQRAELIDFFRV